MGRPIVLMVAEKPSLATSIAKLLSRGQVAPPAQAAAECWTQAAGR